MSDKEGRIKQSVPFEAQVHEGRGIDGDCIINNDFGYVFQVPLLI